MHSFNLRPVLYSLLLLSLSACERDNYTTWTCQSQTEAKLTMVLKKAKMEFQGQNLDFCGSLGNLSYFDQKCPAQTEQASTVLTPSSGLLESNGQSYQCVAL